MAQNIKATNEIAPAVKSRRQRKIEASAPAAAALWLNEFLIPFVGQKKVVLRQSSRWTESKELFLEHAAALVDRANFLDANKVSECKTPVDFAESVELTSSLVAFGQAIFELLYLAHPKRTGLDKERFEKKIESAQSWLTFVNAEPSPDEL